jgi:hypothetical protein
MTLLKYLPIPSLLMTLLLLSGCLKNLTGYETEIENMQVPRLMIESRGIDYAGGTGGMLKLPVSGTEFYVERDPIVGEFDIINVEMVQVDLGMALMIQVTDAGARELYRRSVTNPGDRIVFTSNGLAVGARLLTGETIDDGTFYTFVEIPDDELGQFVIELKASIAELQTRYKY